MVDFGHRLILALKRFGSVVVILVIDSYLIWQAAAQRNAFLERLAHRRLAASPYNRRRGSQLVCHRSSVIVQEICQLLVNIVRSPRSATSDVPRTLITSPSLHMKPVSRSLVLRRSPSSVISDVPCRVVHKEQP